MRDARRRAPITSPDLPAPRGYSPGILAPAGGCCCALPEELISMPYRTELKVRFADIDHAGIVYYPRFLHYFHVAMEEFFAEALGIDYSRVLDDERFGLPTVHLETDFRRPLRYGDKIDVEVAVERIGRTSIHWRYTVFKSGESEVVALGRIVTAGLDRDRFAKREIPGWLRDALAPHVVESG